MPAGSLHLVRPPALSGRVDTVSYTLGGFSICK